MKYGLFLFTSLIFFFNSCQTSTEAHGDRNDAELRCEFLAYKLSNSKMAYDNFEADQINPFEIELKNLENSQFSDSIQLIIQKHKIVLDSIQSEMDWAEDQIDKHCK